MSADEPHGPKQRLPPVAPPHAVRVPVNVHHWDRIAFLHWPVEVAAIERHLPAGLRVDTHRGSAWVGVTPFFIRVRPLGMPLVPPGWAFPETNLRTYAVGPDGRQGIWFLRMEVSSWWFVATLRTIGLPYVRQAMRVDVEHDVVHYRSRPTGRGGGGHDISIRPGRSLDPPTGGPLEQFLTARWDAYHRVGRRLLRTSVQHSPWRLREADVQACDVAPLFRAADLPEPTGAPLAHISPGVTVRVGRPSRVR